MALTREGARNRLYYIGKKMFVPFCRLPFVLPWCTDEDLSDKKSEIRRLYPFMIDGFSKATYEFPMYDFFKQTRAVPKSA